MKNSTKNLPLHPHRSYSWIYSFIPLYISLHSILSYSFIHSHDFTRCAHVLYARVTLPYAFIRDWWIAKKRDGFKIKKPLIDLFQPVLHFFFFFLLVNRYVRALLYTGSDVLILNSLIRLALWLHLPAIGHQFYLTMPHKRKTLPPWFCLQRVHMYWHISFLHVVTSFSCKHRFFTHA